MASYLEITDENFSAQLTNFASKIGNYQTEFAFTDAEILSIKEDAAYLAWLLQNILKITTYKKSWISMKNEARKGTKGAIIEDPFQFPKLAEQPVIVQPGIEYRFRMMVKRVKAHARYTSSIGKNLGIEMSTIAKVDVDTAQPKLKIVFKGGKININWKKGNYEGIYIEKDTGSGFKPLDKYSRPNYVDESPLPPRGQSESWHYRAMYLYKGEKVGVWSAIVSITVAI